MLFGDVSGHKKSIGVSLNSYLQVLRHRQTPNNSTNGMTHTYTQVQAFTSYLWLLFKETFNLAIFRSFQPVRVNTLSFQYVFCFLYVSCSTRYFYLNLAANISIIFQQPKENQKNLSHSLKNQAAQTVADDGRQYC
jgi:hypothetical protein